MKSVLLSMFLFVLVIPTGFAAEIVHGSYSLVCWPYNQALEYAPKPGYGKIKRELQCERIEIIATGADDCKQCGNGQYKCRGYAEAVCKR